VGRLNTFGDVDISCGWGVVEGVGCGSGNDCGFFRLLERLSEIEVYEGNF